MKQFFVFLIFSALFLLFTLNRCQTNNSASDNSEDAESDEWIIGNWDDWSESGLGENSAYSSSDTKMVIDTEIDFRAYFNRKKYTAKDGTALEYIHSKNTININDSPMGALVVHNIEKNDWGHSLIEFSANNADLSDPVKYIFIAPHFLMDEKGKQYKLDPSSIEKPNSYQWLIGEWEVQVKKNEANTITLFILDDKNAILNEEKGTYTIDEHGFVFHANANKKIYLSLDNVKKTIMWEKKHLFKKIQHNTNNLADVSEKKNTPSLKEPKLIASVEKKKDLVSALTQKTPENEKPVSSPSALPKEEKLTASAASNKVVTPTTQTPALPKEEKVIASVTAKETVASAPKSQDNKQIKPEEKKKDAISSATQKTETKESPIVSTPVLPKDEKLISSVAPAKEVVAPTPKSQESVQIKPEEKKKDTVVTAQKPTTVETILSTPALPSEEKLTSSVAPAKEAVIPAQKTQESVQAKIEEEKKDPISATAQKTATVENPVLDAPTLPKEEKVTPSAAPVKEIVAPTPQKQENKQVKIAEKSNGKFQELEKLIQHWDNTHRSKNSLNFSNLYNQSVLYYENRVTRDFCVENKEKLFKNYYDYSQKIISEKITFTEMSSTEIRCSFVRRVTMNLETKDYSSFLVFKKIGDSWKIISEGNFDK